MEGCEVVDIDYAAKTAIVSVPVDTDPTVLIEALQEGGYDGTVAKK